VSLDIVQDTDFFRYFPKIYKKNCIWFQAKNNEFGVESDDQRRGKRIAQGLLRDCSGIATGTTAAVP